MEIKQMVVQSFEKIEKEGLIEKTIQEQIEKTIKSIINDLFRDYSDFAKDLKNKLSEAVKLNLDDVSFPAYNVMIENAIKQQMTGVMNSEHKKLVEGQLAAILKIEEKQEWKLSELIEKIIEYNTDEDSDEQKEQMTLIFDNWYAEHWYIYIDPESDVSKYDCSIKIDVDGRKLTGVKLGECDLGKDVPYSLHGIDSLFFRLYSQGVKIEVDREESEAMTYYPDPRD